MQSAHDFAPVIIILIYKRGILKNSFAHVLYFNLGGEKKFFYDLFPTQTLKLAQLLSFILPSLSILE